MTNKSLLIGSAIILTWLVTMGFLFKSYYSQEANAPAYTTESLFGSVQAVPRWQDVEEYMLIVSTGNNGKSRVPVGATATTIRKVDNPTTAVTYQAQFNLEGKLAPLVPTATVKVVADLDESMNLNFFHGQSKLGPISLASTGLVSDSVLYISVNTGSNIKKSKVSLKDPIRLAEALRPVLGNQISIKSGSKLSTNVLDPISGESRGKLTIEIQEKEPIVVNGTEVDAFRVVSSISDIKTLMWVNDKGETLRRQLVGNLFMERTTKEEALRQAPSLSEPVEAKAPKVADFADIPLQSGQDSNNQPSSGLSMIQSLLQ